MFFKDITAGPGLNIVQSGDSYVGQSGSLHWNNDYQKLTLFNGLSGHHFYPKTATIQFDEDTTKVLIWAHTKMLEEQTIKEAIASSSALKEAYEHFQTILALSK